VGKEMRMRVEDKEQKGDKRKRGTRRKRETG
jgi:hypothetical protein